MNDLRPETKITDASKVEEIKEDKISNVFDLDKIARLKGKPGLWVARSGAKSGMRGFRSISNPKETTIIKENTIVWINALHFITQGDNPDISMGQALDNLFDYDKETTGTDFIPWEDMRKELKLDLMLQTAPHYDTDEFLLHHMRDLLKWYNEFKKALKFYEENAELRRKSQSPSADSDKAGEVDTDKQDGNTGEPREVHSDSEESDRSESVG